jgi:benzoyl-CoA 2,3-dioxygenase component B
MKPVLEAGQYAGWISAPKISVNGKPTDYEYFKLVVI